MKIFSLSLCAAFLLAAGMPASGAPAGDVFSVIHGRKSVREYQPGRPVSRELLEKLVRAGMAAPTAADKRPWAFVIVTERKRLEALAEGLVYGKMLSGAGAAIVVCGVPERGLPGTAREYWVQDCSAATQNILLAAEGSGLGAVWLGMYPESDRTAFVSRALGIPESAVPLSVVSLGYPAGDAKPKDKYDPANVHWEQW